MALERPPFTIGIEEEYLLVDTDSRDLVRDTPPAFWEDLTAALGEEVGSEFMRSQVEIQTSPCPNIAEARVDLTNKRRTVCEIAEKYGMHCIASSTHPFADWGQHQHTDKERYNVLARDMQAVARRLLICGMHTHVGIDDDELRIDLMGQVSYFLPHLLALSTSSPFWRGERTGLMSYRLSVFDELPRTGLPESFDSYSEYQRHLGIMASAGLIEDASKIWWDVRPSVRFPTLEMRIPDVCPRIEDGVCIAALYLCLLRMLYRLKRENQRWRRYSAMLVRENRWRAQRYGITEGLVDFGKGEIVDYKGLLEEILQLIHVDALALDCVAEVEHARTILTRGTSAHRQIEVYDKAVAEGAERQEALKSVVDLLIEESMAGIA